MADLTGSQRRRVARTAAFLAVTMLRIPESAGMVSRSQYIPLAVGVPSLEIPVGTVVIPMTFSTGPTNPQNFSPLPIERRVSGKWLRIGFAPGSKQKAAKKALAGPFAYGRIMQVKVTTTRPGQQVRIGSGVMTPPLMLQSATAAALPDPTQVQAAAWNTIECTFLVANFINSGIHGDVLVFDSAGTQLSPSPLSVLNTGFCESLPINQVRLLQEANTSLPVLRTAVWRSGVIHAGQARIG